MAPSPPATSVGTLSTNGETWAGGGTYVWEFNDASDTSNTAAGIKYDRLTITGSLNVTATSGNKFFIDVTSLTGSTPGDAANFNKLLNYDWIIATTTTGIGTVTPDMFGFVDHVSNNTDGVNGKPDGSFSIFGSGNDIHLKYSAAPEPTGISLVVLGMGGLLARRPATPGRQRLAADSRFPVFSKSPRPPDAGIVLRAVPPPGQSPGRSHNRLTCRRELKFSHDLARWLSFPFVRRTSVRRSIHPSFLGERGHAQTRSCTVPANPLATCPTQAASTWTGAATGAGSLNWSNATNWGGTAPASSTTTDLTFAGITNTGVLAAPLLQNVASPLKFNSITFDSSAGSFFLGGNDLDTEADVSVIQNSEKLCRV